MKQIQRSKTLPIPFAGRVPVKFVIPLLALFTSIALQPALLFAQEKEPDSSATSRSAEAVAADVAAFDQVWETVRDLSWDPDFDLPAWEEMRTKLRPEVESSESIQATREVINRLLESLSKSHYGLIPHETYDKIKSAKEEKEADEAPDEEDKETEEGEAGISIRLIDNQAVVTKIESNGAAEEAGIRVGWVLTKYKQQDVTDLYIELQKELPSTSPIRPDTVAALALESKLKGDVGDSVELVFLDENDEQREVTVTYKSPHGNAVTFGHLPEMVIKSTAATLDGGIGYVWFNLFFDPANVMKDVSKAIKAAHQGRGMIIDMRGNHGGAAAMTMGVGNHFVKDKQSYLGTLKTKDTDLKFVLFPRSKPYNGPVAVLVDECSISSAEILAGGLQAIGRAQVFGVQTAGAALPSIVEKLPNEDRFQFAIAGYTDSIDRNIEGNGVTPDVAIQLTRAALLEGRDPILDAAIAWTNEQSKK